MPGLAFSGAVLVWAGAAGFGGYIGILELPTAAGFGASAAFLLAAVWELWRAWAEPLKARWPLMGFFALHALVCPGGVYDLFDGGFTEGGIPLNGWLGLIHFETLIYVIATAVLRAVICKERYELGLIRFAQSDALNGVANRGAFFF